MSPRLISNESDGSQKRRRDFKNQGLPRDSLLPVTEVTYCAQQEGRTRKQKEGGY